LCWAICLSKAGHPALPRWYAPALSRIMPKAARSTRKSVFYWRTNSGIVLRAITRLLDVTPEVALVGVVGDFEEAVRLADELQPQIVILDLRMAQKANADALRLKAQQRGLRLLAITAANVNDDESIALANDIGADKLLDKMRLDEELIPAFLELGTK
jgi:DNA-binding NarL/FixJ family response regulator